MENFLVTICYDYLSEQLNFILKVSGIDNINQKRPTINQERPTINQKRPTEISVPEAAGEYGQCVMLRL